MRRVAVAVALLLLALPGCRKFVPADRRVAFDPRVLDPAPGIARESFEEVPSRLVLGIGWYGFEHMEKTGPWSGFSWAAGSATIYFGMPAAPEVDFAAVCAPFVYPGSPPQTLTLVLNGHELPTVDVPPNWNPLRLPLPSADMRSLNSLELRFFYRKYPSETLPGSIDNRALAAVFSDVAIVPRGLPAARAISRVTSHGGGVEVTLGADGLAVPLPAGSRYRLRIGAVRPTDSRTPVELLLWQSDRFGPPLWTGPASKLSGRAIDFRVAGRRPAMLILRPQLSPDPAATPPALALDLSVPEVEPAAMPAPAAARPHVFLYLIDTLRADALGVYGSKVPTTPRIDAFARDAVTYERARSVSSWTLPATISLLSGLHPFSHGVMQMGQGIPATGMPWLPEELRRLGYDTAGFWQWLLGISPGVERGFGTFALDVQRTSQAYVKSPSEVARGIFWQYVFHRPDPGQPLFAYVHVCDPHAAYEPRGEDRLFADRQPGTLPEELYTPQIFLARGLGGNPADTAHLRALYDGEVHHADREFGAFLDLLRYLGLYDDSLIVLVADHGEEFYEHGGFDHSRTLYEELLHIPLIVKYPGQRGAGTRIPQRVSILDVAPTILRHLGRPYADLKLQGRPLPESAQDPGNPGSFFAELLVDRSGTEQGMDLAAAVQGDVKCIFNEKGTDRFGHPVPHFEDFDLRADPGERVRLPAADPRVGPCRDELSRWIGRAREAAARSRRPIQELPPEEIRRLRALGYVN